jgi:hypothetical protein
VVARLRSALLRPFRRLRTFMLSDAWTIGNDARDLAREARDVASDARTAADDARVEAAQTRTQLHLTADWVADEIRKARVYGGLRDLAGLDNRLRALVGMNEFRVFSQNGEDGILQFLVRHLGIGTGFFVEIGAERHEANCLLLALHQGWSGVFVDGAPDVAANLTELLQHAPAIRIVNEMVEPGTVDAALKRWGVPGEIDVLSIDVDGADYYVWEAVKSVRARVVIVEYNSALDPTRPLVQRPDAPAWDGTVNFGCSVAALRRLADERGYSLVYLESSGTNAFFVANEHLGQLEIPATVQTRAPNYHLRPNGRHPGSVDESRVVEIGSESAT